MLLNNSMPNFISKKNLTFIHLKQGLLKKLFIYLFIQIAYYTHMGQAITIQKQTYKRKQKTQT
jgi:hypothetical protein